MEVINQLKQNSSDQFPLWMYGKICPDRLRFQADGSSRPVEAVFWFKWSIFSLDVKYAQTDQGFRHWKGRQKTHSLFNNNLDTLCPAWMGHVVFMRHHRQPCSFMEVASRVVVWGTAMIEWCFWHCKTILGRGQQGLMRWIMLLTMPLV